MNGYVNPNIALQVQPVQPINMLGTAAQAIALKAAMQDIQGGEALRNVFAQGGDINDPTVQRQIMAANPKLGGELIKKQADIRKTQIDTLKDELAIRRDALSGVTTPEDYLAWHRANHSGQMGAFLNSIGVKQKSDAELLAEISKPGGLQKAIQASALGATKLQQELMQTERSVKVAGIGAAATMRGQDLLEARERERMRLDAQARNVVAAEGEFIQTDKFGNIYKIPGYGARLGPNAPAPTLPPAAANAFVTTQPQIAGGAPAAPTGAPTVANAMLAQSQEVPRPKQTIRQPVPVMIDGRSVLVPPEQAVGKQPATAFTEKAAFEKTETVRNLNNAISNLTDAIKPGGLLDTSTGSGLGRMRDVSAGFFGQATPGAIAAAKLAPIADLVLKMVPRFEGPQSDKDTQSYREAAGQLADASLPNAVRKGAAETIIKLMTERKDQFAISDQPSGGGGGGGGGADNDPLGLRKK